MKITYILKLIDDNYVLETSEGTFIKQCNNVEDIWNYVDKKLELNHNNIINLIDFNPQKIYSSGINTQLDIIIYDLLKLRGSLKYNISSDTDCVNIITKIISREVGKYMSNYSIRYFPSSVWSNKDLINDCWVRVLEFCNIYNPFKARFSSYLILMCITSLNQYYNKRKDNNNLFNELTKYMSENKDNLGLTQIEIEDYVIQRNQL